MLHNDHYKNIQVSKLFRIEVDIFFVMRGHRKFIVMHMFDIHVTIAHLTTLIYYLPLVNIKTYLKCYPNIENYRLLRSRHTEKAKSTTKWVLYNE